MQYAVSLTIIWAIPSSPPHRWLTTCSRVSQSVHEITRVFMKTRFSCVLDRFTISSWGCTCISSLERVDPHIQVICSGQFWLAKVVTVYFLSFIQRRFFLCTRRCNNAPRGLLWVSSRRENASLGLTQPRASVCARRMHPESEVAMRGEWLLIEFLVNISLFAWIAWCSVLLSIEMISIFFLFHCFTLLNITHPYLVHIVIQSSEFDSSWPAV